MPSLSIADLQAYYSDQVELLRTIVESESPTTDKAGVDRVTGFVAEQMRELGATVQSFPQSDVGTHHIGTWGDGPGGFLLMVHLDTVHPIGTLDILPWNESDGRIYGPGIYDMKASAAMALTAMRALHEKGAAPSRRVTMLYTADEETGSHTSMELIQSQAQEHELVLCLEPALPDGGLKTWRKGIGEFNIRVVGRPAHAGANPGDGVNAIHEMAAQIDVIAKLADEQAGTTLNAGLIDGGTRTNVIPAEARAVIDIRILQESERQRVDAGLHGLTPVNPEAQIEVIGDWNRPPMPRTEQMVATFERASQIASELGLELTEGGTGGGSDANFVAPLGIPVLDGLGARGAGAHTLEEHIEAESLPERTALLAAILTDW